MTENDQSTTGTEQCSHPERSRVVEVGGPFNEPMAVRCTDCGVHL